MLLVSSLNADVSECRQHVIPVCPLLAPFLDRMATNDVANRFTASEALSFCRFIRSSLTPQELDSELRVRTELTEEERRARRWESLPEDFVKKWSIGGHGWVRLICLPLRFFS